MTSDKRNPVRFSLDGRDLRILAAADPDGFQLRDLEFLPRSTLDRRVRKLEELNLLEASRAKRNRTFTARHADLASACADALSERPNLEDELSAPTHLAALTVFPYPHRDPDARELVGVHKSTWQDAIDHLRSRNLLLSSEGGLEPNPRLSGLQWLIEEYADLYRRPPSEAVHPGGLEEQEGPVRAAVFAHHPIHQRGLEVAWRFNNADLEPPIQLVGPSSDLDLFSPIASEATYGYLGPRELDPWDHMFLYCRAQATPRRDPSGSSADDVALRAKAFFLAAVDHRLLRHESFFDRAFFYQLGGLLDEAKVFVETGEHPLEEEIQRFREDFGVEEGSLAR
ncbi:hypothetical protein BRD56_08735 [Thermoplasmatales archaeon SW_10_69_26]|nr:MAG: hypothetical protein BRD56_08735 [Thermoplasmatales archaeon SW_10_69_26]